MYKYAVGFSRATRSPAGDGHSHGHGHGLFIKTRVTNLLVMVTDQIIYLDTSFRKSPAGTRSRHGHGLCYGPGDPLHGALNCDLHLGTAVLSISESKSSTYFPFLSRRGSDVE
jgi:hypothetical protein